MLASSTAGHATTLLRIMSPIQCQQIPNLSKLIAEFWQNPSHGQNYFPLAVNHQLHFSQSRVAKKAAESLMWLSGFLCFVVWLLSRFDLSRDILRKVQNLRKVWQCTVVWLAAVRIGQLLSIKENICAERHRKSYALQDAKNSFLPSESWDPQLSSHV